jgi:hypothetical protein
MNKMNNKNMMYSFFIIPAIFLLVMGGQGFTKIASSCDQEYQRGYNDAQNDYRAGNAFNQNAHEQFPLSTYKAGYSQGYIDARDSLYLPCNGQ